MDDYLLNNKKHWEQGYTAPNVDHPAFRFFGRILKIEFNHLWGDRLVDFGCGQGAVVNFFCAQGYDARGVDISEIDIGAAKVRYPQIADHFCLCDPDPRENDHYGFADGVSAMICIQALYYFSDTHLDACLQKLYDSMASGAVIFATMIGEQGTKRFANSVPADDGLRKVSFTDDRLRVHDYYMNFTRDEDHLIDRFSRFRPLHLGYYAARFRADESDGYHLTFCGVKD